VTAADRERALGEGLERIAPELVRVRRHLHAHPELAFAEVETAALVAERCTALGFSVQTGVGGTGVLADLDSGHPGPTVLVRADMDALPIEEGDPERSYRSRRPGVMHACGHDGHVAVALGVAELLHDVGESWSGRVRMCFQPAEEIDAGARRMIDEGALDGVDAAIGLHLQAGIDTGTIAIGPGVLWVSSDELRLLVRGVGGHAGDPRDTVDPIAAAAAVVLEVEEASKRAAGAVVTIAQLHAGEAPNVICEQAELAGTLRAFGESRRAALLAEVEERAQRAAEARGATVELSLGADCPAVDCDPAVTATVRAALRARFGTEAVVAAKPMTASDDMGRYLRQVPGCYFRVGASDPAAGTVHPHHHPLFDLDEHSLSIAADALTRGALALLDASADPHAP
jgi:amidohydrolase